ncbi:MAG: HEPN domain-containing protein [Pseudomonadota bacterium]
MVGNSSTMMPVANFARGSIEGDFVNEYSVYFFSIMNSKIAYWIELSEYDIATAEVMLESKRYLYVGFMAHQSIEKILKAYFVSITGETAPFTHSLSFLAKKAGIYQHFSDEQQNFIDLLEPMNIEARYPINKKKLLENLTEKRCASVLNNARELREWILLRL